MTTDWKYADDKQLVVSRILDSGATESCLATREDVVEWVSKGGTILPPDTPSPAAPTLEDLQSKADALTGMASALQEQIATLAG